VQCQKEGASQGVALRCVAKPSILEQHQRERFRTDEVGASRSRLPESLGSAWATWLGFFMQKRRKTPSFSYGDIMRVGRGTALALPRPTLFPNTL
jgi:hypothetical protein